MEFKGYDIIGDVHGCALTLERLLRKLDYHLTDGVFRHRDRQVIFLGDIVDRGPHIRESLQIVKGMVDAGVAQCLMGNHEYNAIAFTTPYPREAPTTHVRRHNPRHNRLIAETLEQFASYPEEWRMYLQWFKTLPLFIELPGFRAVHACWDSALINEFKARYDGNRINDAFVLESAEKNSFASRCIDRLTRGTDLRLPSGTVIQGRDGYERVRFRTKFWSNEPETYRDVVFQPDPLPDDLGDKELSTEERDQLLHYGANEVPVFVGHYWLQGMPRPLRKNVACLDYSAVKYGRLTAYRFDGESVLHQDKFVWIYEDPD